MVAKVLIGEERCADLLPPHHFTSLTRVIQGYYFAATQEASQLDIAEATGKILRAHGVIENEEPKSLQLEQVNEMMESRAHPGFRMGHYMFASNSRTKPDRAAKLFGYSDSEPTLWEAMQADLLVAMGKSEL